MYILSFKELCQKASLTTDQVIAATGADIQTVKRWESGGKISREQAKKIIDLAWPHYPCGFTHWANQADDCLFIEELSNPVLR